jgi:serine acetyltransferase
VSDGIELTELVNGNLGAQREYQNSSVTSAGCEIEPSAEIGVGFIHDKRKGLNIIEV